MVQSMFNQDNSLHGVQTPLFRAFIIIFKVDENKMLQITIFGYTDAGELMGGKSVLHVM